MRRKRKMTERQLLLPFEKKSAVKKAVRRKGLSRAEIKATKEDALRLAKKVYASIMNATPGRFHTTTRAHVEMYRKEFGKDIGELKKGRVSAKRAQQIIDRAKGFMARFEIKH